MKYYKEIKNGEIVSYQKYRYAVDLTDLVEITEEEYFSVLAEFHAKAEAETESAEQSKDDRIAELEAENAALLYQVLTGEVLQDV